MNEVIFSNENFRGPNEREVLNVIEEIFGSEKNLKEITRVEDEYGINRLVFETQESEGGDTIHIDFFQSTIDVIYLNAQAIPTGGRSVAVYDKNNSTWTILD